MVAIPGPSVMPDRVLAALASDDDGASGPLPPYRVLREVFEHGLRRARLQRAFLDELRERDGVRAVEVPQQAEGFDLPSMVTHLERALAEAPA